MAGRAPEWFRVAVERLRASGANELRRLIVSVCVDAELDRARDRIRRLRGLHRNAEVRFDQVPAGDPPWPRGRMHGRDLHLSSTALELTKARDGFEAAAKRLQHIILHMDNVQGTGPRPGEY